MSSKLGIHWIRVHPDGRDYAHIEAMQYSSAKLFEWHWSNRDACRDLLAVLPQSAYILARDHPLSEQKQDMWADPEGTGTRHANEWAMKVASGNVHVPTERTFFLGINEADATSGDRNAIDRYNATFLERLRTHGLRGGAFSFSTGHPRTIDGTAHTPADYTVFERSRQAIVEGNHIGVLHIYGTAAVPCVPGHFDRLKACKWTDVEWVVGECGADEHVIGGGPHDGYLRSMADNPARYCQWLDDFIIGINDARIHSYQVFSYDFSHPWDSFDVRAIRAALQVREWRHMTVSATKPPTTTHIPSVIAPGPQPVQPLAWVIAPAGANLRNAPNTESAQVLTAVPYGEQVRIVGVEQDGWFRVRVGGQEGYMAAQLIGLHAPEPLPVVTPPPEPAPATAAGIIEPRVAQAILQVESGGRTHGNDGRLLIRFEAHVFRSKAQNKARVDQFFRFNQALPWTEQEWRVTINHPWTSIHTGKQLDEHNAFAAAQMIDVEAAHQSISMGAPQIMGFNHARIGYPSAQAMLKAFQSAQMQTIGFINFFLSDPALMEAARRKDWRELAKRYNGAGAVDTYAPLLQKAYEALG